MACLLLQPGRTWFAGFHPGSFSRPGGKITWQLYGALIEESHLGGIKMYIRKYNTKIFVSTIFIFFLFFFISKDCRGNQYSPNVHWVFCIDTSGSMKTKDHMDLLKFITGKITDGFIDAGKNIVKTGDRITIFSFDQDVRLEATALYQTENDILPIRSKLEEMNKRNGSLTFISEAIVQAIDFTNKYNQFFHSPIPLIGQRRK